MKITNDLHISPKGLREAGFNFTKGVTLYLCLLWCIFSLISSLFQSAYLYFGCNLDDSDKDSYHRSGMHVRTDYKTGVQYFESTKGFLTPRLPAAQK